MAAPYTESGLVFNGAGEIFEYDGSTAVNTHASTPCTTTVLTMASSPLTAGFRAGDVIGVDDGGGVEYRRIDALDATTITLDSALDGAPGTGVAVTRRWRLMGATQGGIEVSLQTDIQEQFVDQVLDPVAIKGDKRSGSVKVPLVEINGQNVKVAWALGASNVVESGGRTTISVGNSSTTLNTNAYLIIGEREDGKLATLKIQKAVSSGNPGLKFSKGELSVLQIDLKMMLDSAQSAGEELFILEFDSEYHYEL